jgi:hypothetical protein
MMFFRRYASPPPGTLSKNDPLLDAHALVDAPLLQQRRGARDDVGLVVQDSVNGRGRRQDGGQHATVPAADIHDRRE